jgi:hypothetical protein
LADATANFETQSGALAAALKQAKESFAVAAQDIEKAHTSHMAQAEEIQLLKYERQFFGIFIDQFQLANPPATGGHVDDLSDTPLEKLLGDAIVRTDVGVALMEFKSDEGTFQRELTEKPRRWPQAKAVLGNAEMLAVSAHSHFAAWGAGTTDLIEVTEYISEFAFRAKLGTIQPARIGSREFIKGFRKNDQDGWKYGVRPRTFLEYIRFLIRATGGDAAKEGTALLSCQAVAVLCIADGNCFHKTYEGYKQLFQALDPALDKLESVRLREKLTDIQAAIGQSRPLPETPSQKLNHKSSVRI